MTSQQRDHWEGIHRAGLADRAEPTSFAQSVAGSLGATVLELGCGTGADAHFFSAKHQVVALDQSLTALTHAARRYPDVTFARTDISATLPLRDNRFDSVYAHLSLHYFPDPVTLRTFAEVARVLAPSGMFHFMCKSTDDPMYGVGTRIGPDTYRTNNHVRHFFSVDYVRSLFARTPQFCLTDVAEETSPTSAFVRATAVRLTS